MRELIEWLDSLPKLTRSVVAVGLVVAANLAVVAIISLIVGWTEKVEFSNVLFYASAAMFGVSLLLYFGGRGDSSDAEEVSEGSSKGDPASKLVRKRRRGIPFYSVILIAAGTILFLLSIAVWYVLPGV